MLTDALILNKKSKMKISELVKCTVNVIALAAHLGMKQMNKISENTDVTLIKCQRVNG